ncbi:MAG: DUF454 family protein [Clostridia bacterium]|nr:DUF454 family protein [Clostridia bacterium]
MQRILWLLLGFLFLILGVIGLLIPVVPQVPFFIASLLFFAGCIPKLRERLISSKFFQKYFLPHIKKHPYLYKMLVENPEKDEQENTK